MYMDFKKLPFSQMLQDRKVFGIFDDVFQQGTWLDVSALLASESCIEDAYADGTIPKDVGFDCGTYGSVIIIRA